MSRLDHAEERGRGQAAALRPAAALLAAFDFPPTLGGEARLYFELARHLPPDEVAVWAPRLPGDEAIDAGLGCAVTRDRVPAHGGTARRLARGLLAGLHLARLLRRQPPRYLLCGQVLSLGVPMRLLARAAGIPYGVFVHGADVFDFRGRFPWAGVIGWVLSGAETVLVNSRFTAELLANEYPGAARRILVLPMGVEPAPAVPETQVAALRARYGLGDGPVLLTVARLVEAKGHDVVIDALPRILEAAPSTRYLVVGEGANRRALEERAGRLGVADQVVFAGRVAESELPAHYRLGTIFVLLSRSTGRYDGLEGFGLAILEASSHGLPVIGGRTGGIPEAVRHGRTGLVLPAEDARGFADETVGLLADPERRRRLGELGRRFAAEHAWPRTAAVVRRLWSDAGADGTPSSGSPSAGSSVVGGRAERCAASPAP